MTKADVEYYSKRFDMATKALEEIEKSLMKINIWDNREKQVENCVHEIKRALDAYRKVDDDYAQKYADKLMDEARKYNAAHGIRSD